MGIWDKALKLAKNAGTVVANKIKKSANETRELRDNYEILSDDELVRIVQSDGFLGKSTKEKGVAYGILRKRGYTDEAIKKNKSST